MQILTGKNRVYDADLPGQQGLLSRSSLSRVPAGPSGENGMRSRFAMQNLMVNQGLPGRYLWERGFTMRNLTGHIGVG
jgi:hypothetical protein